MSNIYLCQIQESERELLKSNLPAAYTLDESDLNLELVKKMNPQNIGGLLIGFEQEDSLSELKEVLSKFNHLPLFVILRNKNFDALMLCHRYRIAGVYKAPLKNHLIDLMTIKLEVFRHDTSQAKIPIDKILELFTLPLETTSFSYFSKSLLSYFNSFPCVKVVGIIELSGRREQKIGKFPKNQSLEKLKEHELSDSFVGKEVELKKGKQLTLATPISKGEERSVWLVLEIDSEQKDYILNKLLYKFIQNVYIVHSNLENVKNLEILASTDEVTGLFNQRKLAEDLEKAVDEHELNHDTFSLMFIDVDHFKKVNDDYGHIVGSQLLLDMGKVLKRILRQSDHIYRYGGDEFVVIMPNIKIGIVHEVASRVLKQLKAHEFKIDNGDTYHMSVSIGIAEYPTDANSAMEIIRFADEMMYKSKESGRGRVFHVNEVANVDASSE